MWSLIGVICMAVIGNALPITKNNIVQYEAGIEVQTVAGTVVGSVSADGTYREFYGIPYADSTTGVHRFKAPRPPLTFTDVFVANRKDVKCIRPLGVGFEGTEDCLVVDVFTPNPVSPDERTNLPVMVWVKGSEFTRSIENHFSFKNLIEKDVIVVSLNYRESIFGFLCLGTETAPGNVGLKDIVAGLRWVKENIRNFGGNPDDITLFGHGSGAAAVDLITLSPTAEGLIQKAISQSGNALAPWAVSRDNLASAIQVAEALGHTDFTTVEELSEVFTRVSAPALMAIINEFEQTDNSLVFAPCVEREISGVEPFLVKTPYEIISEGEFLKIPFMTGFVDMEGTIRAEELQNPTWLDRMQDSFSEFLQPDLKYADDNEKAALAAEIRRFYFEDDLIPQSVTRAVSYYGDTMVLVSAIREARLRVASATTPLYLYQFSYRGTLGQPLIGPLEVDSAAHSEELAYLFHNTPSISDSNDVPDRDLQVADILIERWTNFAKTGIPTGGESSQIVWQPFTAENPNFLRIFNNNEVAVSADTVEIVLSDPHPRELAFWDEIYAENFLDAESNWEIISRDEDEDDDSDVTTPSGGEELDVTTAAPEDDATTTPAPDSASTAVGYTFMIISIFALIDKFHSSQILS